MDKLTLRKLYNTEFPELYKKLQIGVELSDMELEKILTVRIFLIRMEHENHQKL